MKLIATLFLAGFLSTFAAANEQLSCQDIEDIGLSLIEVGNAVDATRSIELGGELDQALGELIDALYLVSDLEKDRRLTNSINRLDSSYANAHKEDFLGALKDIVLRLNSIYQRDCN